MRGYGMHAIPFIPPISCQLNDMNSGFNVHTSTTPAARLLKSVKITLSVVQCPVSSVPLRLGFGLEPHLETTLYRVIVIVLGINTMKI